MHLTFSPSRRDMPLTLHRAGDVLTINGEAFDFAFIPEGGTLPKAAASSEWFASDITRIDGALHLTLVLPHGARAPQSTLFPEPIILTANGPVSLPAFEETEL